MGPPLASAHVPGGTDLRVKVKALSQVDLEPWEENGQCLLKMVRTLGKNTPLKRNPVPKVG